MAHQLPINQRYRKHFQFTNSHEQNSIHTPTKRKIVKIDPKLTILISLRRPIKIKFHGTDSREEKNFVDYTKAVVEQ